ncbi:MAG: carboxypeptidase regulatory-like domain-containing protein, partial [Myxococcales bacterium]|nr:carboxypeptidase regulatory-like domain-containing protein [Myxococcales bacterium]
MNWKPMLAVALLFVGCGGSSDDEPTDDQAVTVVFGLVTDAQGGPVAGVRVAGGGAVATTGDDGTYQLDAAASGEVVVRFELAGHLRTVRSTAVLEKMPVNLDVTLVAEAPAMPLDATAGGEVEGARGAKMAAPAGAFVDPMGASVGGMVSVHLTPLDPGNAAELNAVTGRFVGRDQGGETTLIESFGMIELTVRQDDATLQVAPGQTLQVQIPAPAGVADPPATMPLWSHDPATDTWVEEGTATYDADTGTYQAEIGHLSSWNCDQPAEATCITGLVQTPDGDPLPGAAISASGVDYSGTSTAVSLDDGRFYVAVRRESRVSVLARHASGGGEIREVTSGVEPTSIPPTPGDPRCLDVGVWTVERGVIRRETGGGVEVTSCDDVD